MQDPTAFQVQPMMMKPHFPEQEQLKCPRCDSINTKFCYYNNYNLSQPRHFCKNCRRYWTKGGALRNIPVGGGSRKSHKRSSGAKRATTPSPSPSSLPLPSISQANAMSLGSDLTRVNVNLSGQDPLTQVRSDPRAINNIRENFGTLLSSSGRFGSLLESLNSSGSGLKMIQVGEFGGNSGLDVSGNGGSEIFRALQNGGDSSGWNGSHGWSDLAIYTPGSSFQ